MIDILPDSRARHSREEKIDANGVIWERIFCLNCGCDAGYVPKQGTNFVGFLCDKCNETYGCIAHTYAMPDEVFQKRVAEELAELAQRGSGDLLSVFKRLDDPSSALSKLVRERDG